MRFELFKARLEARSAQPVSDCVYKTGELALDLLEFPSCPRPFKLCCMALAIQVTVEFCNKLLNQLRRHQSIFESVEN
jgi:hypothetical protein